MRVIALNNSYEAVRLDRRLLIGPNSVTDRLMPLAREAALDVEDANFIELGPWCLYGRDRRCPEPKDRPFTFHAYLLKASGAGLRSEGPADPDVLEVAADPLVVDP